MFKKKQRNTFKSILYLNKIMSITLKLTIVTTLVCLTQTEPCKPSNVQCLNEYEYKICITINGQASLQGTAKPCPNHQFCDDSKPFPCIDSPTTIKDVAPPNCTAPGNFTATLCNAYYACAPVWRHWEPRLLVCPEGEAYDRVKKACGPAEALKCAVPHVGQPECKEGDVHPANQCNQYYVCARKWLFWEPSLKTCPSGYAFNAALKHCTLSKPLNCFIGNAEATGTLESEIVPDCTGKGRLPSVLCNQYYECVSNGWFSSSYTAQVVVCPEEEAFDQKSGTCEPAKRLGCWIGVATTLAPTTLPPVLPPKCTKNTRYPAQQCNQYYQCIPNWFSWKTVLQTCKEGDAFDPIALECSDALSLNCKIGVPTTTPLPTTPIPTTPMPILPPVCKSTGNHPATLCNEYYKCIRNWFSWKVELQTCKAGDAFDPFKMDCGPADLLNCKRGIQTTVSEQVMLSSRTTPSLLAFIKNIDPVETPKCEKNTKLSASQCNQYYQCVSYWFSWKAVLQTCAPGEAFDATKVACGPAGPLNCSLGVVETTVVSTTNQPSTKMQYTTISPEIITTLLPDLPPTCTTTSNHTAPLCNQYYECIREWFSWTYILLNCPEGLAFDSITLKCVQTTLLKCKIAFNSTLVSTIEILTIGKTTTTFITTSETLTMSESTTISMPTSETITRDKSFSTFIPTAEPSNMVESTTTSISTAETSTIVEKTTNFISTAKNLTLSVPITTSIPKEEILTTVKSIITSIPTSESSTLGGSTISSIPTSETSTIVKSTITSIPMAESSTLSKSTTVSIPTAETSTMVESITTSIPTEESSTLTKTSTLGGSTITSIPTEEISTTFKSTITSIPTLETLTIVKSTITSIPTAKSSTLSKSTTISIPTAETSTLGRSTITSISTKETSTTENSTLSEPITTSIPTEEISTTVKSIITSIPTSETLIIVKSTINSIPTVETSTMVELTTTSIPTVKSSTLGGSNITSTPTEEISTTVKSIITSIPTSETSTIAETLTLGGSTTNSIPTAKSSTLGESTITFIPTEETSTIVESFTTSILTTESSTLNKSTTTFIPTAVTSTIGKTTITSIPTAESSTLIEPTTTSISTLETSTMVESTTTSILTAEPSIMAESTTTSIPTAETLSIVEKITTFIPTAETSTTSESSTSFASTENNSSTIESTVLTTTSLESTVNTLPTTLNTEVSSTTSTFLSMTSTPIMFTTTKAPSTTTMSTTITLKPVLPPKCTSSRNYPATYCNQYYQCYISWFSWKSRLETCKPGLAFNTVTSACESAEVLKCDYGTTTSTTTTTTKKPTTKSTTTTTTSRPISPPECTGPDTFPTSYCNEYYKCVYVMSFWDYNIQTCPSGQFYNPETKQCSSVKINHYCT